MNLMFGWATPVVQRGYTQEQLQTEDLLPLPPAATPRACTADLWHQWSKACCAGKPSLLRALVGAYGGPYYALGVLKLLNDGLTFAGAMLLNLLVRHLEQATVTPPPSSSAAAGGHSSTGLSSSSNGSSISFGSAHSSSWLLLPGWCPVPGSPHWGFLLAGLLGLSALAKAIIGSQYNYRLNMVAVRLRAGVMGVLFRTALLSRAADSAGDVNTLMTVDTGRLANLCVSFHELWSLPLQIAAAMWLLYAQVRTAFLAGVVLCVALIPVNRMIAQRIQAASVSLMSAKDARLALMGQLLAHMAVVKALGWEQVLADKVRSHRSAELAALSLRKYLDALCVYFWAATQLLLSGTTFGLMVLLGQPLRPSVVFTCLALFNVLIAPLNAFPWVVNGVVEALVSLQRLQAYLLLPQRAISWAYTENELPLMQDVHMWQQQRQEQQQGQVPPQSQLVVLEGQAADTLPQRQQKQQQQGSKAAGTQQDAARSDQQMLLSRRRPAALERGAAAQFDDATFAWQQSLPPCLLQLQLAIPAGCLTAVVGEVGSGKSSLLAALLGELELLSGRARLPNQQQQQQQRAARIGYVGQTPWLLRGSVRDNVLLGQPYDAALMRQVLQSVGLDADLAAMPAGELSPVGDGGQGLSGGQRLRVALARALYQPGTDAYLFDDVLASLDGHVAQWVIRHTLLSGLLSGATVVVVTKHPAVIQAAQLVVALDHGRAVFCGSPQGYSDWKALQACQQYPLAAVPPQLAAQPPGTLSDRQTGLGLSSTYHHQQHSADYPHQQQQQQLHNVPAAGSSMSPSSLPGSPAAVAAASGSGDRGGSISATPVPDGLQQLQPGHQEGYQQQQQQQQLAAVASKSLLFSDQTSIQQPQLAEPVQLSAADKQQQQQQQQQEQQSEDLPASAPAGGSSPTDAAAHGSAAAAGSTGVGAAAGGATATAAAAECLEDRAVGAVRWSVYAAYMRAVGIGMSLAVLLSLLLMQATKNGIDLWVTHSLAPSTPAAAAAFDNSIIISSSMLPPDPAAAVADMSPMASCFGGAYSHASSSSSCLYSGAAAMAGLAAAGGASTAAAAGVGVFSLSAAATVLVPEALLNSSSSSSSSSSCGQAVLKPGLGWQQQQQQQQQHGFAAARVATASSPPSRSGVADGPYLQLSRRLLLGDTTAATPTPGASSRSSSSSSNSNSCSSRFLQFLQWHPAPIDAEMAYFLKGLAIIAGLNTLATLARAFSFAAAGMAAAASMHQRLLAAVLAAPMAFFDDHPAGRILNRFSSDTSMVDDSLPFIFNILLANTASLAGLLAVLLLGQPLLAVLLLPLGVAYRRLQLFYRACARELRRLEAQGLSPLYGLFGEALSGAPTLRAAAAQSHFMQRFLLLMEPYQSACASNAAASNWLSARLQLLAAALLSAVACLAAAVAASAAAGNLIGSAASSSHAAYSFGSTGERQQSFMSDALFLSSMGNAGSIGSTTDDAHSSSWAGSTFRINLLGLALAYCLPIVQLLNGLLSSSAETEQEMVAVERVVAYLEGIVPEERQQQQQQLVLVSSAGPAAAAGRGSRRGRDEQDSSSSSGSLQEPLLQDEQQQDGAAAAVLPGAAAGAAVAFVDVVLRYRPGLPPALQGVNFSVSPGQKLGICGRTGAGKSSIVSALLRLRPIQSGFIIVQGDDASTLNLRVLRGRFGVVPQSPVLFSGSVRDNLDPWGRCSDRQLAAALQAVHLWAALCSAALQRGVLSHGSYLLACKAGCTSRLPAAAAAAATGTTTSATTNHTPAAAAPEWEDGASAGGPLAAAELAEEAAESCAAGREAVARQLHGGRQQQRLRQSTEFPPAPMTAAQQVLDMQVCGVQGLQLSLGQSQLLCLARLLLRAAPLVLLDEATAAVDPRTAALMHQVLHEQLDVAHQPGTYGSSSGSSQLAKQRPTVLQIAHELTAVIEYDAVVVMAAGRVVESGDPKQLAAQQSSKFAKLLAQAQGHHHAIESL